VYRNTWSPGYYDFSAPAASVFTAHNESRFDAFFFGGDFQQVLRLYTTVTGKPFLVPVYGLGLGDSDCYHNERHGNSTRVVLSIADEYRERRIPGAWFLPNDGYGCGYGEGDVAFPHNFTDLDYVVAELHKRLVVCVYSHHGFATTLLCVLLCRWYALQGLLHRTLVLHWPSGHQTRGGGRGYPDRQGESRRERC
jgi:hypothetical protein